jgi:MFS family permease
MISGNVHGAGFCGTMTYVCVRWGRCAGFEEGLATLANIQGRDQAFQICALGVTQTIAWASSTYLPAVLSTWMAASLGTSTTTIFAAYSCGLLVMAALGPMVGRAIDQRGGREVLCLSNGLLIAGLCLLASAEGVGLLFAAWAVMGAGMALGLYDATFAALVRQHGIHARRPITGITLLAGFASTVGWPMTSAIAAAWGWQTACLVWAALHLLLALPLNWICLPAVKQSPQKGEMSAESSPLPDGREARRVFVLLAVFGAATAFVTSAMAAHLPGLLQALGIAAGTAIAASALVGPAQVVARIVEFVAGNRFRLHPLVVARIASILHPLGGAILFGCGLAPWAGGIFALLHGAGNGLLTIAKGTLPLALFGPWGYGVRQGVLAVSQRITQAAAPFLVALILEHWGGWAAIALTGGLSGIALFALEGIRRTAKGSSTSAR